MACFTTQYPLTVPYSTLDGACMVGDDIWYIHYPIWKPRMCFKFNTELKQWQEIECQNPDPVEYFIKNLMMWGEFAHARKSKIYFRVRLRISRLVELDTNTRKWRTLMTFPNDNSLFHNDNVYSFENDKMEIRSVKTDEKSEVELPCPRLRGSHRVVANDSLYFITRHNGTRDVYQWLENQKTFLKISKDNEPSRSYLQAVSMSRVWSYKDKIYHCVYKNGTLTVDLFDFETKDWITISQSDLLIDVPIRFMFGTDTKIYIIEHDRKRDAKNESHLTLHVIDLRPTSETKALLSVSDRIAASSDNQFLENVLQITLPKLRQDLKNMVEWKRRDIAKRATEGPKPAKKMKLDGKDT